MHLLDLPKPGKHARFPWQWKLAALMVLGWGFSSDLAEYRQITKCGNYKFAYAPAAKPNPVQYVTMTTLEYGIPCDVRFKSTHQEPLMELYDELCEIEERAERDFDGCFPRSEYIKEQDFLNSEKALMRKYGLTQKQVAMIKQEAYRMKQENKE